MQKSYCKRARAGRHAATPEITYMVTVTRALKTPREIADPCKRATARVLGRALFPAGIIGIMI